MWQAFYKINQINTNNLWLVMLAAARIMDPLTLPWLASARLLFKALMRMPSWAHHPGVWQSRTLAPAYGNVNEHGMYMILSRLFMSCGDTILSQIGVHARNARRFAAETLHGTLHGVLHVCIQSHGYCVAKWLC